jgi:hypothetical protein
MSCLYRLLVTLDPVHLLVLRKNNCGTFLINFSPFFFIVMAFLSHTLCLKVHQIVHKIYQKHYTVSEYRRLVYDWPHSCHSFEAPDDRSRAAEVRVGRRPVRVWWTECNCDGGSLRASPPPT